MDGIVGKSKPKTDLQVRSLINPGFRTESANAKRFIDSVGDRVLFVSSWGKWLVWDGKRWRLDEKQTHVMRLALKWSRRLWSEYGSARELLTQRDAAQVESFCKASNSDRGINAMIHLASSDDRIQCDHKELDCKPHLLNCDNGTLDLQTGELRPHDPADRITQLSPTVFDASATCPKWLDTLSLIFQGDGELIRYVQAILGYCTSGDVGEHILPIAIGSGANGKSTVWHVVSSVLGDDYAMLANESLLLGEGANHPTDKAALLGKRFVPISEPERGAKLKEARVKELTGDTTVTARRMREDFWSFNRTHKFFLASNHLPKITGTDDGIWRRVKVVPFAVKLAEVTTMVKGFEQTLAKEESSGVLNWLVAGFQDWHANGFIEPQAVKMATAGYRQDSDPLGEWLADNCIVEPGAVMAASEGFESFTKWQEGQGIGERFRWTQTRFGRDLADRFTKEKPTSGAFRKQWVYHGLRLRGEDTDTPENGDFFDPGPVGTSTFINPIEKRVYGVQQSNWGQVGASAKPCPKCGHRGLTETPAEEGWVNLDCPRCGHTKPQRVKGQIGGAK